MSKPIGGPKVARAAGQEPEPPADFGLAEPLMKPFSDSYELADGLRDLLRNIREAKATWERFRDFDLPTNPIKRKARVQHYNRMIGSCDWWLSGHRPWVKALQRYERSTGIPADV